MVKTNVPSTQGLFGQRFPTISELVEYIQRIYSEEGGHFYLRTSRTLYNRRQGPDTRRGPVRACTRIYRLRG